jgi:magnesium-transporting ATPase (P-type)
VLGMYAAAVAAGKSEPEVRLLAFSAVVVANVSLIFFARSAGRRVWQHIVARNRALWWIVLGTLLAYAVVVAVPAIRSLFRIAAMTVQDVAWLCGGVLLLWLALAMLQGGHALLASRRLADAHR